MAICQTNEKRKTNKGKIKKKHMHRSKYGNWVSSYTSSITINLYLVIQQTYLFKSNNANTKKIVKYFQS